MTNADSQDPDSGRLGRVTGVGAGYNFKKDSFQCAWIPSVCFPKFPLPHSYDTKDKIAKFNVQNLYLAFKLLLLLL